MARLANGVIEVNREGFNDHASTGRDTPRIQVSLSLPEWWSKNESVWGVRAAGRLYLLDRLHPELALIKEGRKKKLSKRSR